MICAVYEKNIFTLIKVKIDLIKIADYLCTYMLIITLVF